MVVIFDTRLNKKGGSSPVSFEGYFGVYVWLPFVSWTVVMTGPVRGHDERERWINTDVLDEPGLEYKVNYYLVTTHVGWKTEPSLLRTSVTFESSFLLCHRVPLRKTQIITIIDLLQRVFRLSIETPYCVETRFSNPRYDPKWIFPWGFRGLSEEKVVSVKFVVVQSTQNSGFTVSTQNSGFNGSSDLNICLGCK